MWLVFMVWLRNKHLQGKMFPGIIFSSGARSHNTRRFLLRNLRDLGMGKSKLETIIMSEVEELVDNFKDLTKEPLELPLCIHIAVLNILWQLVASKWNYLWCIRSDRNPWGVQDPEGHRVWLEIWTPKQLSIQTDKYYSYYY